METSRQIWTDRGKMYWELTDEDGKVLADGTGVSQDRCEVWLNEAERIAASGVLDDPGDEEDDEDEEDDDSDSDSEAADDDGLDDDEFEALADDLGLGADDDDDDDDEDQ